VNLLPAIAVAVAIAFAVVLCCAVLCCAVLCCFVPVKANHDWAGLESSV